MKTSKKFKCVVAAALLCAVGVASAAYVSDPFGAFPGGGTNWTADWADSSLTLHTVSLGNDSPIKDGGSYLVYRTLTGATVGSNGLARDFETSIAEGIHTIKLNVRVDEFGNFFAGPDISDRMQIFGDSATQIGDQGTYSTWTVMAVPTTTNDNWYVYDGIRTGKWSSSYLKDSTIAIVPGGVYSFTIKAYPATLSYDVTISDGTKVFTKNNCGYRAGPALNPGDRLCFGNKVRLAANGGSDLQLSYDSIRIFANGAYRPQPTNGQIQVPAAGGILSWTRGMSADPDPNVLAPITNPEITGHYVYLSAANDPTLPTTPVFVTGDSYVLPVALEKDATYYWRVDGSTGAFGPTDDPNLIKGPVWSFLTEVTAPVVWAGQNVVSYLEAGTATVQLAATIDWTNPQSTILWSVDSQPDGSVVQFSNAAIEDPIVTMDTVGTYVLSLEAQDTKGGSGEDVMEIHVYADSCQAAQNVLGYQAFAADINDDCRVNMNDFALLAADWLEQNYLLDNFLY